MGRGLDAQAMMPDRPPDRILMSDQETTLLQHLPVRYHLQHQTLAEHADGHKKLLFDSKVLKPRFLVVDLIKF